MTVSGKRHERGAKHFFIHQLKSSLGALLISVMAMGGVIYHFSEQVLIETVEQSLRYHADFRKERIRVLFEQQKQWMLQRAANEVFKLRVDTLVSSFRMGGESSSYQINSERFRNEYGVLLKEQGVEDLFLINQDGKLLFSLRSMEEELGVDLTEQGFYGKTIFSELIDKTLQQKQLVISRYGKVEQVEQSAVLMGVPLYSNFPGEEGDLIAVMVRPISLERLRELLESYSGLGDSGEVMLGQWRGEGVGSGINFINHFRNDLQRQPDEACQRLRRNSPEKFSVHHALNGENGAGWLYDNSCRRVYAVWSWLPGLEWGMVVKQDRQEIMAPVVVLQQNILFAALLVLLFLVWVVQRQARSLVHPVEQLTEAAERGEIDTHQPGKVVEVNHLAEVLKRNTAALMRAKQETDLILESMDEGLIVINAEGMVSRVNPKLEQMVGEDMSALVGRKMSGLFSAEQELCCVDGTTIPITLSRAVLDGLDGEREQEVLMVHDLRQLLKTENAIRANQAKDQFLAMMSHELRTPLTSIIGYSEMMLKGSGERLTSQECNMLNAIEISGRTQLTLINDILDLSKIEAGKFEVDELDYDLGVLLDEVKHIFSLRAEDAGIDFQIVQKISLHHQLLGDPKRIGQILMNLLSNAIKFTEQGRVTLEVIAEQSRQQLQFRVTDEGIGMAPEVLDRLFQPFEQADSSISSRFGGTGLGLHISWTLAELMGGMIDVESAEGKGSTFILSLPYRPSEKRAQTEEHQREIEQARFEGRVLLVEDTVVLQRLEQALLEAIGVEVVVAVNGQDALEKALSQHFDLVLMDMQMPVMDGIEATATLRSLQYEGVVVALTANVMPQHQREFEAAGCNGFLHKPIDQQALRRLLQTHLRQAKEGGGNGSGELVDPVLQERHRPIFLDRLIEVREELSHALLTKEWSTVKRIAHDIKGSAAMFGYDELSDLGKQICDAMERGEYEQLLEQVGELIKLIDQVLGVCWVNEVVAGQRVE